MVTNSDGTGDRRSAIGGRKMHSRRVGLTSLLSGRALERRTPTAERRQVSSHVLEPRTPNPEPRQVFVV